jgi:hypothetical protein
MQFLMRGQRLGSKLIVVVVEVSPHIVVVVVVLVSVDLVWGFYWLF